MEAADIGALGLVSPASISTVATAATTANLRTIGIYITSAARRDVAGRHPDAFRRRTVRHFGHDEATTDKWSFQHFSLAHPENRGASDLPKLLLRVATEIEKRQIESMDLLDGDDRGWSLVVGDGLLVTG